MPPGISDDKSFSLSFTSSIINPLRREVHLLCGKSSGDYGKRSGRLARVICLDTETTGLNRDHKDEILQLAMVRVDVTAYRNDMMLDQPCFYKEFNELYGTRRHVDWKSSERFHHIKPQDVYGKPSLYDTEKAMEARSFIDPVQTLIGYNVIFDLEMLDQYTIDTSDKQIYDVMYSFTKYYSKKTGSKPHHFKLVDVARYFGRTFEAHDALEDSKATLFIWNRLMQECDGELDTYTYKQLITMRKGQAAY